MSNSFGTRFRLTTYGESHGPAIGGVVDGCPAGVLFDNDLLVAEMGRRHLGTGATPRIEADSVEILSGVYQGRTLGTPIAFVIRNQEADSSDYDELHDLYRPGHADYTYAMRHGYRDHRGGGRASGRETATRVVGGTIAKMLLREKGITVEAKVIKQGVAEEHDSAGGIIECTINGLPAGIGNPVFGKLNALLAAAMMSIPSAIGFEMGAGFAAAMMTGSSYRDKWSGERRAESGERRTESGERKAESGERRAESTTPTPPSTITNHCGGIQGGISNGMPIVFRTAFHPVVTIDQPTECLDKDGILHTWHPRGRHDTCHIPRTVVVVEAMAAITIADFVC